MIKWVECYDGTFVRWTDIIHVYHQPSIQEDDVYHSRMKANNGDIYPFLLFPDSLEYSEVRYDCTAEFIIQYHGFVINELERNDGSVISLGKFTEEKYWINMFFNNCYVKSR